MSTGNPFELVTASKLSAQEAIRLWCDDKRLARVTGRENCFINGHRGTGKSMLFRVLQHDCQSLLYPSSPHEFVAVYFPVRDTEFLAEEFNLYQSDTQKGIISESHFCLLLLRQILLLLRKTESLVAAEARDEFMQMVKNCLEIPYRFSAGPHPLPGLADYSGFLRELSNVVDFERERIFNYVVRRLFTHTPFDGPLFMFDSVLRPIGDFFLEKFGQVLYLLIDDGDDLPESHTIVLNSWIARRHPSVVFKISTMFGYKTYETRSMSAIQHPHDFFQYDIATRYMSDSAEDYIELLREICQKRLRIDSISLEFSNLTPESVFPEDEAQKKELEILAERLTKEYESKYRGRSVRDYVYRHLTSEYMKELARRHTPDSFVYSGFKTLAILSSGLVRDFIICAQRMFDNASRTPNWNYVVPPSVQNRIVRNHADNVLAEIADSRIKRMRGTTPDDWQQIKNVVDGLGNLFKAKMLSDDADRRVFSFAFQYEPEDEIERLLDLAVAEGYFMKGFISRKEGTGRRTLYVLTRRVGPAFNLDVSSYSGYLSLTPEKFMHFCSSGAHRSDTSYDAGKQMTFEEMAQSPSDKGWVFISPDEVGL